MNSNPLQLINNLIKELPEKDIKFGEKFLLNRDFESLKDLIDSAIIRINRSLNSKTPREEYININMEELLKLKSEVDTYKSMLDLPDQEEEDIIDDEENNWYNDN